MIVVTTHNGAQFINEAETLQVRHIKDKQMVEVWPRRWSVIQDYPHFYEIENVEGICYLNNKEPACIKDEGSEVERMLKSNNEKSETIERLCKQLKAVKDDLRSFAFNMEQLVCHYSDKIPEEVREQILPRATELRMKVLNNEYTKR